METRYSTRMGSLSSPERYHVGSRAGKRDCSCSSAAIRLRSDRIASGSMSRSKPTGGSSDGTSVIDPSPWLPCSSLILVDPESSHFLPQIHGGQTDPAFRVLSYSWSRVDRSVMSQLLLVPYLVDLDGVTLKALGGGGQRPCPFNEYGIGMSVSSDVGTNSAGSAV